MSTLLCWARRPTGSHLASDGVAHTSILTLALALGVKSMGADAATLPHPPGDPPIPMTTETNETDLQPRQQAIVPIAAHAAIDDMPGLNAALIRGLDAGLTVSDCKEILVQMYAYAGFPRSLNALSELMRVLQARKDQGIEDAPGRDAGPIPRAPHFWPLEPPTRPSSQARQSRGPCSTSPRPSTSI